MAKRQEDSTTTLVGVMIKIKTLKSVSYGLGDIDVYWRRMLLWFVPSRSYLHTI